MEHPLTTWPPRCELCGELIGVYERLVHLIDDDPRETSRAADPHLSPAAGGAWYHAACYEPSPLDDLSARA